MTSQFARLSDGFVVVDLSPHLNNTGTSLPTIVVEDGIDGMGRTLPTEELASMAPMIHPITGWGRGVPDNVVCDEQVVAVSAPAPVSGWSVIGATRCGPMQDTFTAVDSTGHRTAVLVGLSDLVSFRPAFSDTEAAVFSRLRGAQDVPRRTRLWRSNHGFDPAVNLREIEFPLNPDMHVFALVLWPVSSGGVA
ncbi:MAG: hypothetical protein HY241_09630 [Actinobacteria bacterium]|nr:hypothetical protein [Actinomycetota bacterium]